MENGYIQPLHGPEKDGYQIWYFRRDDVESFFNLFIEKSLRDIEIIDSKWLTFEKVNFIFRPYNINTIDLIRLLLEDTFRFTILKDKINIKGIMINAEDVYRFIKSMKLRSFEEHGFRTKQLIKVFRVGAPKINSWIQEGKLTITHEKKNKCGNVSRYVSLKQVKQLLMKSKKWDEAKVDEYILSFIENI